MVESSIIKVEGDLDTLKVVPVKKFKTEKGN
jgi:hypothetical protein